MAYSLFNETFAKGKKYTENNFRCKRIQDKYLLTTDHGAWVVLDKKEKKQLVNNELSDDLFKILEQKGVIITKNNLNLILKQYKQRYHYLFKGPSLHIIIPTLRCNQKCFYCHSSSVKNNESNHDMDEQTAKKTLEFIFQSSSKDITIEFQGGEPTLNLNLLRYIVLEAKKMNETFKKNLIFALITNLTLMNNEILEFVKKEKINLCTSIDGPKEIHDKNRKYENGNGTYDDVINSINKIKSEASIGSLMVTTKNSLRYWKEIIDEYLSLGYKEIQIKYMNKLGYAKKGWENEGYSAEEFIDFWKKSMDYIIELNKNGVNIKERYAWLILIKILSDTDPSFLDFRSPCGMIIGQIAYNYNGDIYTCDEGRNFELFKLGNVKENNLAEIISSEKAVSLIKSSINDGYLCDSCVYKPYCGLCPVVSYAEDNNIISNIGKNSKCKIHKAQFDYIFEKILFDEEIKKIFLRWFNNDDEHNNDHEHKIIKKEDPDELIIRTIKNCPTNEPLIINQTIKNKQKEKDPKKSKKILILHFDGVGDTVQSLPFINLLRENYPEAEIDVFTRQEYEEIFRSAKINKIIPYKNWTWQFEINQENNEKIITPTQEELFKEFKKELHEKYDLVFNLNPPYSPIYKFVKEIKPKISVGIKDEYCDEYDFYPTYKNKKSNMFVYLDFLKLIGIENIKIDYTFPLSQEDKKNARILMTKKGLKNDEIKVCLITDSSGKHKIWSHENFEKLIERLVNEIKNIKIILIGKNNPFEKTTFDKYKEKVINLFDIGIKNSASIINECDLVISNDTGLMHLSAALKKPIVALFGISNPRTSGPYSNNSIIIEIDTKEGYKLKGQSSWPWIKHTLDINKIPPDYVFNIVIQQLKENKLIK